MDTFGEGNDQNQDTSNVELELNIERLRESGKLKHVALLALTGDILAVSRGMSIGPDDGFTIIKAIDSPYRDLTKVNIGKQYFVCFKRNDISLVGRSDVEFLCCWKCEDIVIVGLSDLDSQGSSIYEISRFVERYNSRNFKEARRDQNDRKGTLEASPDPGVSFAPETV